MRIHQATLAIACLLAASPVLADELKQGPSGEWATQGYSARVRVAPCPGDTTALCGEIVWLWNPLDDDGTQLRDSHNPKADLRQRPLIGLHILSSVRRDTTFKTIRWVGTIYDPESGRTYRATLTRSSDDILEVEGCVLFVCRSQTWRRAASLCPSPAAPQVTTVTSPKEMP